MKNKESDLLLLKRIKEGDTSAFRTIAERYKDVSLSLALSILKNKEEAEDIVQESFIKVFKNLQYFRSESSFSTWLYRIVVTTCLNHKESRKKKTGSSVPASTGREPPGAAGPLLDSERKAFILEALGRLREEEALLLRLYYLCDLKIVEIMEITGLSESNIKVILYRGRKSLLEALKTIMGDEIKNLL